MKQINVEDVIKKPDIDKLCGDCIKIEGIVEIINGDTRLKYKNKFVNPMLTWLINSIAINDFYPSDTYIYFSVSNWDIYLGTNQATPTIGTTNSLTSPIGTTPGTPPSSKSGSTQSPSAGIYRVIFTGIWNPDTVSGTVGEMALYLTIVGTLKSFGTGYIAQSGTKQLVSRLAAADGTMTAFAINTTAPLAINWTIQFSFT